jgi:polyhydroxybutyrate depolymerase
MSNPAPGPTGVIGDGSITVAGVPREYRLVVPDPLGATPVPLVVAFHGRGDSKDQMPLYTGLSRFAEQNGFILVYPNAQNKFWPLIPLLARDDLAFFDALYAKLLAEYPIDRARVYLIGMSNGAYFSHWIASQRPGRIAAIAAHSGGLGLVRPDPGAVHKHAALLIHGELDPIIRPEESRRAHAAYVAAGYSAEYIEVPNYGHFWAGPQKINVRIWEFFQRHSSSKIEDRKSEI